VAATSEEPFTLFPEEAPALPTAQSSSTPDFAHIQTTIAEQNRLLAALSKNQSF
jgi:hypothetical protein